MAERIPLPTRLDAVFIDAGGVLIVPDVETVMSRVGITHSIDDMLDAFTAANDRLDQPQGTDQERHTWLWNKCFESLGYDSNEQRFIDLSTGIFDDTYNPFFPITPAPGVHDALRDLAAFVDKRVVLSNANGAIERELVDGGVISVGTDEANNMYAVIDSTVVGVDKPNVEIFEIALDRAGATKPHVVHIGDSAYSDMEGARRAGIAGIHIDRRKACTDETHHHARDLVEAVALLQTAVGS